jgi:methyl-accepting chemotaxis protein
MSFTETNGEQVLGAVQGNRFRWGVAVQQDENELFAPLRETLGIALALLAGAALLVAVIAWLSSRLLIRPILDMTYAADRMSLGELDAPISVSRHDELGLLAHSLERLRRSMKSAMARLRSAS